MTEVAFTIPADPGYYAILCRVHGHWASRHAIKGWGVTKGSILLAKTDDGIFPMILTTAILYPSGKIHGITGSFDDVDGWLDSVRKRFDQADREMLERLRNADTPITPPLVSK